MASIPSAAHELFAVQHGHVARHQLLAAQLSPHQITHLIRRGDLVPAGRYVYRSPSWPDTELGRCARMCLGRPGVTIAGPTAGRLWGLRKMNADLRMHVLMQPHANSVPRSSSVVARRTSTLRMQDIVFRDDGIRVTSLARTCLDLARSLLPDPLLSVIEHAMLEGDLTEADMRDVAIGLVHGRPWVRSYLAQLDRRLAGSAAESDGETRVGEALRAHGVDGLIRQHPVVLPGHGPVRFDLAIPQLEWAVEIDLFPTHEQTVGAAADRRRDVAAANEGWIVRRVTRHQYESEFNRTIESLVDDARARSEDRASCRA